jgi:DNA-binding transcriptional regulator/RsmH inhibitor MraZ
MLPGQLKEMAELSKEMLLVGGGAKVNSGVKSTLMSII